MRVKFSKNAAKFLESPDEKNKERIRNKIKSIVLSIEETGILPFKEFDIKILAGEWKGFMRMKSCKYMK